MNFGFFGVQFSFGLQQSNLSAIYKYLGANESELPMLWLAGPVTGLVVEFAVAREVRFRLSLLLLLCFLIE